MAMKISASYSGIGQLLRGDEMKAFILQKGAEIASRAGGGYGFRTHNTGQRQAVNIYPETEEASQDNLDNNTLLRSMK